jgi:serine/threonine protein kinase
MILYAMFEWDVKLNLSLDIAKGLNYLHSVKIAHRDLVS